MEEFACFRIFFNCVEYKIFVKANLQFGLIFKKKIKNKNQLKNNDFYDAK